MHNDMITDNPSVGLVFVLVIIISGGKVANFVQILHMIPQANSDLDYILM